ncbi:MAG: M48 family metallopeptidase [Candidatus Caenarcaniphilales bacterium]|nr:M48 family metallopeptidase [Candidatus Caenarcaniphilales bacterium]
MKFSPKKITENVNISRTSPLKEFVCLLGILTFTVMCVYFLLGIAIDFVAPRISSETEKKIISLYSAIDSQSTNSKEERKKEEIFLQNISDRLFTKSRGVAVKPKIVFTEKETVNAFAYPSGEIVFCKGLLTKLNTENEVAFILAHEMGHYGEKHILKQLGRGTILLFITSGLFGVDNSLNSLIVNFLNTTERRFSQKQEQEADLYAIELLFKSYGHANGAISSLEKILEDKKSSNIKHFFSTHPHPGKRIQKLKQAIKKHKLENTDINF